MHNPNTCPICSKVPGIPSLIERVEHERATQPKEPEMSEEYARKYFQLNWVELDDKVLSKDEMVEAIKETWTRVEVERRQG